MCDYVRKEFHLDGFSYLIPQIHSVTFDINKSVSKNQKHLLNYVGSMLDCYLKLRNVSI